MEVNWGQAQINPKFGFIYSGIAGKLFRLAKKFTWVFHKMLQKNLKEFWANSIR